MIALGVTMRRMLVLACIAAICVGVVSAAATAQDFAGAFSGMSNSSEPVQIEADRLEVVDGQGVAIFHGNVSVTQGTTTLKTKTLKAFYARDANGNAGPAGNLRRIEASGRVAVRSNDQMATADNVVVDMTTQIATLSGDVVVSQGDNVIRGCSVTVNMKTNEINMGRCRVKMLLTPEN